MSNEKKVKQQNHKRLECTEYPSDKWKYIDTSTKLLKDMSLSETPYCFVAGTLVHTDKGLVPIEEIKVGDMVLSRPENGKGEVSYKKVTKTFVTKKQPIWGTVVEAYDIDDNSPPNLELILSTAGHPFWKKGDYSSGEFIEKSKWTVLSDLMTSDVLSGCLYLNYQVIENEPLFRSMNGANEAFFSTHRDWQEGFMVDIGDYNVGDYILPDFLSGSQLTINEHECGSLIKDYHYEDVYNIEVADFHTYFVGECGIWVHDTSNPRTEFNEQEMLL